MHSANRLRTVAGCGFFALDILLRNKQEWQLHRRAGGTCGNVLAILSFLGFEAVPIARLGTDKAADVLVADLQSVGVDCQHIQRDSEARTPRVIEFLPHEPGEAHHFAFTCPMCQRRFPRRSEPVFDRANGLIRDVHPALFFFDRSGPTTVKLASDARENGALVMFEPDSFTDGKGFNDALQVSHIVKYSAQRGQQSIEPWLHKTDSGPRLVIETMDGGGLKYAIRPGTPSELAWRFQTAFAGRELVDEAGAGDWCSAGLIARILTNGSKGLWRDRTIGRALAFGQALAAASISFVGPRGYLENASQRTVLRAAVSTIRRGRVPEWISQYTKPLGEPVGATKSGDTCALCLVPIDNEESS